MSNKLVATAEVRTIQLVTTVSAIEVFDRVMFDFYLNKKIKQEHARGLVLARAELV